MGLCHLEARRRHIQDFSPLQKEKPGSFWSVELCCEEWPLKIPKKLPTKVNHHVQLQGLQSQWTLVILDCQDFPGSRELFRS